MPGIPIIGHEGAMTCRPASLFAITAAGIAGLAAFVPVSEAQRPVAIIAPDEAREQFERASAASAAAQTRAQEFAQAAQEAEEAATRAANEAAALAARVQSTEAQIAAAQAQYSLAQVERARLTQRLANRQEPLVRLTAALQTSARRPLALSALQPGSLKDVVYVRAVLDSAVPQVRARTAALRDELEEGRRLERRARRSLTRLREAEVELETRRIELASVEARQRAAFDTARGSAAREEERALALAEDARDLDGLVDQLDQNALRRRTLAALPGPVLRPGTLGGSGAALANASTPAPTPSDAPRVTGAPQELQLPVQGRTITGFGERRASGLRSKGLSLAPQPGAQIVAPANGRVAFAGPYEGFGRIVIIEHADGWTSLVTGLARTDVEVSQDVIGGAPLGVADDEGGVITIELREGGEPVNPLDYVR
ncbi:MAG: peptidoglycan DD-metalloendopeptidase family protein [Pseudomonadota bacterium]